MSLFLTWHHTKRVLSKDAQKIVSDFPHATLNNPHASGAVVIRILVHMQPEALHDVILYFLIKR